MNTQSGSDGPSAGQQVELTLARKVAAVPGGDTLLNKRASLNKEGELILDGAACNMSCGELTRRRVDGPRELAEFMCGMGKHEALILGLLRPGIAGGREGRVRLDTAERVKDGTAEPGAVARTQENLIFKAGSPGVMLLDLDKVPADVLARVVELLPADVRDKPVDKRLALLKHLFPQIGTAARVARPSASAATRRAGDPWPAMGTTGVHAYLFVKDAADIPRANQAAFDRLWLVGLGHLKISKCGSLLTRTLIDESVARPERLVFEGEIEVAGEGVEYNVDRRKAAFYDGELLDTRAAFPDLNEAEKRQLEALLKAAREAAAPEAAAVRERWEAEQVDRIVRDEKVEPEVARERVRRLRDGALPLTHRLVLRDGREVTMADVVRDPGAYHEALLDQDPGDGERTSAKLFHNPGRGRDRVLINTFRHGGTVYHLDPATGAAEARAAMTAAGAAADTLLGQLVLFGLEGLNEIVLDELIALAMQLAGRGRAEVKRRIKAVAEAEESAARRRADQEVRDGGGDPRPVIDVAEAGSNRAVEQAASVLRDQLFMLGSSPVIVMPVAEVGDRARGAADDDDDEPEAGVVIAGVRYSASAVRLTAPNVGQVAMLLNDRVRFVRRVRGRLVPADCPPALANRIIESAGLLGLDPVAGIVNSPLFRGGEIVERDGYDPVTGGYMSLGMKLPPIPVAPGRKEASAALDTLLVAHKGYLMEEAASADEVPGVLGAGYKRLLASIVASILTAVIRPSLPTSPAILLDANVPGAGKGKFARALGVIGTGRLPAIITDAQDGSGAELDKRTAAVLLSGASALILDNLNQHLHSTLLESMTTEPMTTIRPLGTSEAVTIPTRQFVVITANNATVNSDFLRRCLTVRLVVRSTENPEARRFDFDPYAVAQDHRGAIVAAAFTILRAWHLYCQTEEGRAAAAKLPALGSFEEWSQLVGGATQWLCGVNPVSLIAETKANDAKRNELSQIMRVLWAMQERRKAVGLAGYWKAADAAQAITGEGWRLVLDKVSPYLPPTAKQIGMWLQKNMQVVAGGFVLERRMSRTNSAEWSVVLREGAKPPKAEEIAEAAVYLVEDQDVLGDVFGRTKAERQRPI